MCFTFYNFFRILLTFVREYSYVLTSFHFPDIALWLHLNMSGNIYIVIFEPHNYFPKKLNKLREKNRNIDIFFILLLNIIKGV